MDDTKILTMLLMILLVSTINMEDVECGSTEAAKKLSNVSKTYNKKLRPFADGDPVNVSVQIAMVAFGPIDEKDKTFKVDIFLRQWWNDERLDLGNDSLNYNGDPSDFIWIPDTFITNAREKKSHKALTHNIRTKIGPKSNVFLSYRLTATCSCKMDLALYPMDEQSCSLLMESYSYTGSDLMLKWKESIVAIEFVPGSLQLSGYEIKDIKEDYVLRIYGTKEMFPLLKATFKVSRTFSYYLFHTYLPTGLLVVLTWSTFWIPDKAVPARITLIVTNFLSTAFILQSASSKIPKVPYTTPLEVYLFTNVLFIIAVLGEYLLVLNFCSKKEIPNGAMEMKEVAGELKKGENEAILGAKGQRLNKWNPIHKIFRCVVGDSCHVIDGMSRIFFPMAYAFFLIIYIICYTS